MMPKLFLSHSRRDAGLATSVARELRRLGVEAFDACEGVASGEGWRRTIKAAIRRAKGFVLVVGVPEVASSSWTGYELGMAEALGKPILILLSHNRAVGELPVEMSELPVLSFDPENPEQAAREVVDRLLAAA